jgi:hypothetical protein
MLRNTKTNKNLIMCIMLIFTKKRKQRNEKKNKNEKDTLKLARKNNVGMNIYTHTLVQISLTHTVLYRRINLSIARGKLSPGILCIYIYINFFYFEIINSRKMNKNFFLHIY